MHQCASAPARLGRHDCDRSRESERDNLGCQPWLLVAPGLGHPWPLVIGGHPWPSGDILGCCHRPPARLLTVPDIGPCASPLSLPPPTCLTCWWWTRLCRCQCQYQRQCQGTKLCQCQCQCHCQHQCTSPVISSATSPAHQCACIQSTRAPVSVPAERVAKRAQGRRGEGADLQHLGVTVRPGPDQGAAIKGIPPMMRVSPAVEVRADPDITIYTATGVAILVLVNLSL